MVSRRRILQPPARSIPLRAPTTGTAIVIAANLSAARLSRYPTVENHGPLTMTSDQLWVSPEGLFSAGGCNPSNGVDAEDQLGREGACCLWK